MSTSDGPSDARRDIRWVSFATLAELQQAACRRIIDAARRAIAQRGEFLIVLAGGNTPRAAYRMLRAENADWSHWNVYFGDERCLPPDDVGTQQQDGS